MKTASEISKDIIRGYERFVSQCLYEQLVKHYPRLSFDDFEWFRTEELPMHTKYYGKVKHLDEEIKLCIVPSLKAWSIPQEILIFGNSRIDPSVW